MYSTYHGMAWLLTDSSSTICIPAHQAHTQRKGGGALRGFNFKQPPFGSNFVLFACLPVREVNGQLQRYPYPFPVYENFIF